MHGLNLAMVITDRENTETAIRLFQENNVFATDVVLGKGTAPREILEYLYLSPVEKAVVLGVVTQAGTGQLLKNFKRKMYLDVPGNGIALTVPLNSIGGKRSLEYMLDGQVLENGKSPELQERMERMSVKTDYEVIFVVANEGYSDMIMDAARDAGATGGTIIKAKGTGAAYTEKFFGFSIASEKEIHLLVTPAQGRNAIMKAIMEKAGLDSKAQSIVFSLPVSHALGLHQPD